MVSVRIVRIHVIRFLPITLRTMTWMFMILISLFCFLQPSLVFSASKGEGFRTYWYDKGAEITRFELEQVRYGEIHSGHAVLIFVTEPFLPDIQVKADSALSQQKSIPVLKLNFIKRFNTGIYDYSLMMSVFTPLNAEHNPLFNKTLKVSTTRQDWCGQVYLQYNLGDNFYKVRQNSYFEKEGDRSIHVPATFLEDGIWTCIRISPELLPQGEIKMIPGSFFTTLHMISIGAEKVIADLSNGVDDNRAISKYTLTYPSLKRTLSISFSRDFPYDILSWQETCLQGSGKDAKVLTTRAWQTNKLMIDYWNKNSVEDTKLRKELGLME